MADVKISELYSLNPVTTLDGSELSEIVDSDGDSGGILELVRKAYYNDGNPNVYVAFITQSSTGAPTVFVIKNTLSGAIVWTRNSAGLYTGTLAGAFDINKTACFPQTTFQQFTGSNFREVQLGTGSTDTLVINTFEGANGSMVNTDGVLSSYLIKIEVYL